MVVKLFFIEIFNKIGIEFYFNYVVISWVDIT